MSVNQQLETTGSRSIVPSRFKPMYGTISPRGEYEYLPGAKITDAQMVEEADRILGAYDYAEGMRPYVIISFVRQSELVLGESASQLYDMFKVRMPNLKNMLPVYDKVDHGLWNPGIAFEIMKEVAYLQPESQEELLKVAKKGVVHKGETKRMTLKEFQPRKAVFLAALPAEHPDAKFAGAAIRKTGIQPDTAGPFKSWIQVFFRAPDAKEDVKKVWLPAARKAAVKSATASIDEALRGYVEPKYLEEKRENARKADFAEMIKGIPEADQFQFIERFDKNEPPSEIRWAVGQYRLTKTAADELDKLLNTVVDKVAQAEFRARSEGGEAMKTVTADVNAHNRRAMNVTAINTALDEAEITDNEKRAGFVAQLDATPAVKLASIKSAIKKEGKKEGDKAANVTAIKTALDEAKITDEAQRASFIARLDTEKVGTVKAAVKTAGKDTKKETDRKAGIDALLNEIPEEQRVDFLATANVNGSIKDFRDKKVAWATAKARENKGAVDKRREDRKTLRGQAGQMQKMITQKTEAANTLRQAGQIELAEKEDAVIEELKVKVEEILTSTDREEAEDRLLLGQPAHPKPSAAAGKPRGKKATKRAKKHSKR